MKTNEKEEHTSTVRAVAAWMRERFPPLITLPLAAVLTFSGQAGNPCPWQSVPATILYGWLILLALRIIDDLTDLEHDRIWHPRRTLSRGWVTTASLGWLAAISVMAAAALAVMSGSIELTVILASVYLPFFLFKSGIPALVRPFWINLVFGLLITGTAEASWGRVALGAFGWLAATGHDFCHSIADMVEQSGSAEGKLRLAAQTGIVCYGLSFVMALVALVLEPNIVMALALACSGIWLGRWLLRLWEDPGVQTARALYVRGFLAFVLPLAARIVGFML